MASSKSAKQQRHPSLVERYLNEPMSYGGVMSTRGDIIRDLQRSGADAAWIDRYMQGAELRIKLEERNVQPDVPDSEVI